MSEWRDAEAWRTRLEQRCRVGDNLGGEEDSALLTHWVKELDDFQQEEAAYMAKMRYDCISLVLVKAHIICLHLMYVRFMMSTNYSDIVIIGHHLQSGGVYSRRREPPRSTF